MKAVLCLAACLCLMGVSCEPEPVTITLQYANSTDIQVAFQAIDATNTLLDGSQRSLSPANTFGPGPTVDSVIQITGVPPIIFSAPFQIQDASCAVPTIIGMDNFAQFVWRVEATNAGGFGTRIECVNDQGNVRAVIQD